MSTSITDVMDLMEKIGKGFEALKDTNEKRLDEERKGNEARAKELAASLDKISAELSDNTKKKQELEKRISMAADRIEILESLNDRPRATPQQKLTGEYKDAFLTWARSGGRDRDAEVKMKDVMEKSREFKDVTIGTTTAGGFALPEQIGTEVDKLLLRQSEIMNEVKTVQVGTSDYKELISIHPTAAGTSSLAAGWVGETGSRSATSTSSLRERAPTWGELYAYPQASEWSLQDLFFDVQNWITSEVSEGFALNLSASIYSGNGTSQFTGMTNTTPVTTADYASPLRAAAAYQFTSMSGLAPTSPNVIHGDSLINLVYSLNPRYRANAKFSMNTVTQGIVRRLKTSDGQYIWQPSFQMGQPDRLLGYPVFTWENLGNANTVDAFCVAFGDFKKGYLVAFRKELAITVDQVTNPGYTRFYVRRRYGGCPLNNDAVKFLRNAD